MLCRHQLAAQHADLEVHTARVEDLEAQLASAEGQLVVAEERARHACSGLALAEMTAEQAQADAKRYCAPVHKPLMACPWTI